MTNRPSLPAAVNVSYGALGLVTAGAGLGIIWGAANLQSPASYSVAGPEIFPYLIGTGLVLLGLLVLHDVARRIIPGEYEFQLGWRSVLWVAGGLLAHLVLIERLGWTISSSILFAMGARGFGSRSIVLDVAIGMALSMATVVLFELVLGLRLPASPFSSIF